MTTAPNLLYNLKLKIHSCYISMYSWSKVKVIPQQAEVAQSVPGRLRPRFFLTFRHYKGGRSSSMRTGRFYPRRNFWYSFSGGESTTGHMVPSREPRKKSPVTPTGIDRGTVRLLAQCLNHYATPGSILEVISLNYCMTEIFCFVLFTYCMSKWRNYWKFHIIFHSEH